MARDEYLGQVTLSAFDLKTNEGPTWYRVDNGGKKMKLAVSGDLLIEFLQQDNKPQKRISVSNLNPSDQVKVRVDDAIKMGNGLDLDLSAINIPKVPSIVFETNLKNTLTKINLEFNGFTSFPMELEGLPHLTVVNLTGNSITSLPSVMAPFRNWTELYLNGNQITVLPDSIQEFVKLEKFHISNNGLTAINPNIGRLKKLEEFLCSGNPLGVLPASIGACQAMEILDLSGCELTSIPGEFTYMTRCLELNLATNFLTELPQSIGRMHRLCILNLSDNQLSDLPLSIGLCIGLGNLGSGLNVERNPLHDQTMKDKWRLGPDQLLDYLEKRMMTAGGAPKLEEFDVPMATPKEKRGGSGTNSPVIQRKAAPQPASLTSIPQFASKAPISPANPNRNPFADVVKQQQMGVHVPAAAAPAPVAAMDDKINTLKKWIGQTISNDFRVKLSKIQSQLDACTQMEEVLKKATDMKKFKPAIEQAKTQLPPYDFQKAALNPNEPKLVLLKKAVDGVISEVSATLKAIQQYAETTPHSKDVISMVQLTKSFKTTFDEF
eukprot:TRINITY_DN2031_c0_g1_i2.p1 TRINITY_DN2031_c0_g1~~TRINITY_DN2031_c0_g1_i2.p1  ORF type:complete len:550 (-),score=193.36 TRINITY_DN2031_c0_g1_i2:20-1669(-)